MNEFIYENAISIQPTNMIFNIRPENFTRSKKFTTEILIHMEYTTGCLLSPLSVWQSIMFFDTVLGIDGIIALASAVLFIVLLFGFIYVFSFLFQLT